MSISVSDLVRVRSQRPEAIAEPAAKRARRPLIGDTGRLMIVAVDKAVETAVGLL